VTEDRWIMYIRTVSCELCGEKNVCEPYDTASSLYYGMYRVILVKNICILSLFKYLMIVKIICYIKYSIISIIYNCK
jgi:hypothetical protein